MSLQQKNHTDALKYFSKRKHNFPLLHYEWKQLCEKPFRISKQRLEESVFGKIKY